MKKLLIVFAVILLMFSLVACDVTAMNGKTPYIQNGYWYIDGVNTGVKAEGVDGIDGKDGINGVEGETPYIQDGYWYIDGVNTGVKAEGIDGKDGQNGIDSKTPTIEISEDGYWVINSEKTSYRADEDSWCSHNYVDVGIIGNACEKHNVLMRCEVCGKLEIEVEDFTKSHNYINEICTACGDTKYSDGLELGLSDDGTYYTITGIGTCTDTDLILPSIYNGLPVTSIGDYAFQHCSNLKSIEISNSITNIGYAALSYCTGLTSIEIPNSVKTIGHSNVYGGYDAFCYCANLKTVVIGAGLISIGNNPFNQCPVLTNIIVNENNEHFKSIGGNLYTKDAKILLKYATGKQDSSFVIPDGVTEITAYAFADCNSLASVVIPDGVTGIASYTFYNCSNLKKINIPDGVKYIAQRAFESCINLENVVLPESLESLGYLAFSDCDMLESITISKNVSRYEESFCSCDRLQEMNVDENNQHFTSIDGNLYSKDGKTFIQYANGKQNRDFVIPNGVTTISRNAFRECETIRNVTIPSSVTELPDTPFFMCYNLENIIVDENNECYSSIDGILYDNNVTRLIRFAPGKHAYRFDIPQSVSIINDHAFAFANKLYIVQIHENVTKIGVCAFMASEPYIYMAENNPNYTVIGDNLYSKDGKTLLQYRGTNNSFTVPDHVTTIGVGAFGYNQKLQEVIINSDIAIQTSAFYSCTSLQTIVLPKNSSIDTFIFGDGNSLESIYYKGSLEEWNELLISHSGNSSLLMATLYLYSESEPTTDGNYWHYVNGVPTIWE